MMPTMRTLVGCVLACTCMTAVDARADDAPRDADDAHPARAANPPREHGLRRALPATMVAIGGLAVAGGLVAFALDEKDIVTPPGQTPTSVPVYTDTTPVGIAAVATGAVVAGIGVVLFFRDRRRSATPQMIPIRGGAVVGIGAHF